MHQSITLAQGRPAAETANFVVEASPLPRSVSFRPFLAGDVVQLALQPSQHVTLGLSRPVMGIEDGEDLAEHCAEAWTAIAASSSGEGGRIIACAGLRWLFPAGPKTRGHAVAWALLTAGLGADHLAVTRFFGRVVRRSPLSRIEAIVRAGVAAEGTFARLCGMTLEAELQKWGPDGEPHQLYARIGED